MPKTLRTDKARQGRRGFPVVVVLVCGLLLAMAVWWGVEIYGQRLDDSQKIELQQSRDAPETPTGPVEENGPPENGRNMPPAN